MARTLPSRIGHFSKLSKHILHSTIPARTSVNLSYKIIADNDTDPNIPPLFLLHGLLGTKRHYESLGRTLLSMTKRSVVTVDLRNHGDSPHVSSHRYDQLAKDVLRLLEKLHVDKACLIGHSMGGRTSMCVSLMAPDTVIGLLVIDISPASSPKFLTEYIPKLMAAMRTVKFNHLKNIGKARKEVKRYLSNVISDDLIMRTVLSNIKIRETGVIGWACNIDSLIDNLHYITSFPSSMNGKIYSGPTLFVGGQMSDFIPPDDLIKIRDYFPSAVVHYVPKTGHNLHVEEPTTFLEHVIAFVKGLR